MLKSDDFISAIQNALAFGQGEEWAEIVVRNHVCGWPVIKYDVTLRIG